MKYNKTVILRDGRACLLRNADENDTAKVLEIFDLTHAQTDFLLTYPDEKTFTFEEEEEFLRRSAESDRDVEIIAVVDGGVVGSAGFYPIGKREKIKHRAELGISVDMNYWGLGIGRSLLDACIECAEQAGFEQLELQVIGENERAVRLYERAGFKEFGRNPKGFKTRDGKYQDLVDMRLEIGKNDGRERPRRS